MQINKLSNIKTPKQIDMQLSLMLPGMYRGIIMQFSYKYITLF